MFRQRTTRNLPRDPRQRGFSMIEMAVVLLVIAVIAAFVVPQVIVYLKMYRLGVAARNVATALQRARYPATSDNKRAGINISEIQRIDMESYDNRRAGRAAEERRQSSCRKVVAIADDAPRKVAFDGRGWLRRSPERAPLFASTAPTDTTRSLWYRRPGR